MSRIYTPVSAAAKQVYTPASYGTPHCIIFNSGTSTVYLGQAGVTYQNGLPLPPNVEVSFPNAQSAIYAVAGGVTVGSGTTTSAILPSGSSQVGVTSITTLPVGTVARVGTTSTETLTVTATSTAPSVTFATKAGYYHPSGATIVPVTGAAGSTVYTVQEAT
jgi:hypothetical protein